MKWLMDFGVIGVVLFFFVFITFNIFIGGWAVQYTVQFWGTYFKGVPVHVPFLPCMVAGLFFGEVAVPAAIATWVLSFVL
ncbi:MAG: hypothetical protein A3G49_05370 [Candidatus Sungbacteria bacterium RIFCSPLOWO2_12_FULL_41_11]|uniref:Uncharacterized protein n=1 Tax=Candidatus Sungbacteria bacterium RIFCSPLOWO2_12_FULL_41_11 TaxID=1802286 RepID=A0A1G2LSS6_9BACT|nr:MAG: hypothetical protein A3G49_05370 [Candidatus Sungbacteria bacterium RIFCSPLOWO2_12_FULL_41_11]